MASNPDDSHKAETLDDYLPSTTLPTEDSGSRTGEDYRYQYLITCLFAIWMSLELINCRELYCEMHEDILIARTDGKYEGIQVKTRQRNRGLFSLAHEPILKSLEHFIMRDKEFPNKFEKFWIISDCEFRSDRSDYDVRHFLKIVTESANKGESITPVKANQVIDDLAKKCQVDRQQVIAVLARVQVKREDEIVPLWSVIKDQHLRKLPGCKDLSITKLERILKSLENAVKDAATNVMRDPSIKDYFDFMDGGEIELRDEIINSRRITPELVMNIVRSNTDGSFYLISDSPIKLLEKSNMKVMQYKMARGGLDRYDISNMKACVSNAERYLISGYYKGELEDEKAVEEYLSHIQQLILTRANDARSEASPDRSRYGRKMLTILGNKLDKLTDKNSPDFLPISYDVLKGFVGMLAGHCLIWFSKETKVKLR